MSILLSLKMIKSLQSTKQTGVLGGFGLMVRSPKTNGMVGVFKCYIYTILLLSFYAVDIKFKLFSPADIG